MIKVTYIDHMGSDLSVVNAARVSFGKKKESLGWVTIGNGHKTPVLHDTDKRLIRYLAKHKHYSPFNHTFVTFHVKAPIFVARQLVKHEYMPWNEISRRYVDEEPEFYQPDAWRGRSEDKKQGSDGVVDFKNISNKGVPLPHITSDELSYTETMEEYVYEEHKNYLDVYKRLLHVGVAPEQARMVLPQSTMTEWYWSGTMKAVHKMCSLRCKPDTQLETQIVANHIDEEMAKLFPVSWEALRMYEE